MANNGETSEKRPTLVSQRANIEFSKVTVKWPVASAEFDETTLSGISFRARPGQCLAVIGQVGSGKTTLLNAILGELPVLSGSSIVHRRIAYASQEYLKSLIHLRASTLSMQASWANLLMDGNLMTKSII